MTTDTAAPAVTVAALRRRVAAQLRAAGDAEARASADLDARLLIGHALGFGPGELILHDDETVTPAVERTVAGYVASRAAGMPVARITGVKEFGFYCQGIELPAEGLVPIATLAEDFYDYEQSAHSLIGRRTGHQYRLGDEIHVEVARVDLNRRILEFRIPGGKTSSERGGRIAPRRNRGNSPQGNSDRSGSRRPGGKRGRNRRSR